MALLSGMVILGSSLLSLVESDYIQANAASATYLAAWEMPTIVFYTPAPGQPTYTAMNGHLDTKTPTPTFGPVAGCVPPVNWVSVMSQVGDSLQSLAIQYHTSAAELAENNCLPSDLLNLTPGIFLFVPAPPTLTPTIVQATATLLSPTPTITATIYRCGAPAGWVAYIVRQGDTLFRLSWLTGVSVFQVQQANCMGRSTTIVTGQTLYLPFIPVFTPVPSRTPFPTLIIPTNTTAATFTPVSPIFTPTSTSAPPEFTPTTTSGIPTPTITPVPTDTSLPPTPTNTPVTPTATMPAPPIPTATTATPIDPTIPPPVDAITAQPLTTEVYIPSSASLYNSNHDGNLAE